MSSRLSITPLLTALGCNPAPEAPQEIKAPVIITEEAIAASAGFPRTSGTTPSIEGEKQKLEAVIGGKSLSQSVSELPASDRYYPKQEPF